MRHAEIFLFSFVVARRDVEIRYEAFEADQAVWFVGEAGIVVGKLFTRAVDDADFGIVGADLRARRRGLAATASA